MTDRATWRRRILDSLADEGVDVELGERQLDNSLRKALQLYSKYQPNFKWFNLGAVGPTNTQTFSSGTGTSIPEVGQAGVVDVVFQDIPPLTRALSPLAYPVSSTLLVNMEGPRRYAELRVSQREKEMFTGQNPDWYWEPEEQKLYIYSPARPIQVMALVLITKKLEDIKEYHEADFEKAAVAHAKYLLARILGKFGSIPGPQGDITTDADALRSEAREDLESVESTLARSLRSVPPPRFIG